jgi:hypothetical protein
MQVDLQQLSGPQMSDFIRLPRLNEMIEAHQIRSRLAALHEMERHLFRISEAVQMLASSPTWIGSHKSEVQGMAVPLRMVSDRGSAVAHTLAQMQYPIEWLVTATSDDEWEHIERKLEQVNTALDFLDPPEPK